MGQEGERRTGVWRRWALIALGISVATTLYDIARDEAFGNDIEYPALYLLVGIVVGFVIFFSAFALAELWSRHRGRQSLRVESQLPAMPALAWVQSAIVEADRDCMIDSCHGDDRRVVARGRWNRWTSRDFQLTIDRTEGGCRAICTSELPPRFFDRGKTEALVARANEGLRWRCEDAVRV